MPRWRCCRPGPGCNRARCDPARPPRHRETRRPRCADRRRARHGAASAPRGLARCRAAAAAMPQSAHRQRVCTSGSKRHSLGHQGRDLGRREAGFGQHLGGVLARLRRRAGPPGRGARQNAAPGPAERHPPLPQRRRALAHGRATAPLQTAAQAQSRHRCLRAVGTRLRASGGARRWRWLRAWAARVRGRTVLQQSDLPSPASAPIEQRTWAPTRPR
jgi:hypothetical protein